MSETALRLQNQNQNSSRKFQIVEKITQPNVPGGNLIEVNEELGGYLKPVTSTGRGNMATRLLQHFETPDWPEILQAHRGWLSSVVYARVRDAHAVDEILQETALAASRQSDLPEDNDGLCKWLYRVAVRQAMLYRRRQFRALKKVRESAVPESQRRQQQSESANPVHLLIASEDRNQVRAALGSLRTGDREVLMLKYREGWNCREIASRLGVSEQAVKSRLLRARKLLRLELLKLDQNWNEIE